MDALSIVARQGLMAAGRRFEASAAQVVQGAASGEGLAKGMVEMVQAKHQFSANLKVIRFASEMWDALLNIQSR